MHSCFSHCYPSILTVSLGRRLGTPQPVAGTLWDGRSFEWEGSMEEQKVGLGSEESVVMTLVLM